MGLPQAVDVSADMGLVGELKLFKRAWGKDQNIVNAMVKAYAEVRDG